MLMDAGKMQKSGKIKEEGGKFPFSGPKDTAFKGPCHRVFP
jgi:hypothetical protein